MLLFYLIEITNEMESPKPNANPEFLSNEIQKQVHSLISEGNTKQAFNLLKTQSLLPEQNNTLEVLKIAWAKLQQEQLLGLLSVSDELLKTNKINYQLLSFVSSLMGDN